MIFVVLASKSQIKQNALAQYLNSEYNTEHLFNLTSTNVQDPTIPEQPVGIDNTIACAKRRIAYAVEAEIKKIQPVNPVFIALESGIVMSQDNKCYDFVVCAVKPGYDAEPAIFVSKPDEFVEFPKKIYDMVCQSAVNREGLGFSSTAGNFIAEISRVPHNNWQGTPGYGAITRTDQMVRLLADALPQFLDASCKMEVLSRLLVVEDFPKKGVKFQDLSLIMQRPNLRNMMLSIAVRQMKAEFGDDKFDTIVGLDARGFIWGSLLADRMNKGFVMARKPGKIPRETVGANYGTEYSQNRLEIMKELINPRSKVVIVDDLVATGGSLKAVVDIVKQLGGEVVGCYTILKVDGLLEAAKKKLDPIKLVTFA